jgi:hypothetical protein
MIFLVHTTHVGCMQGALHSLLKGGLLNVKIKLIQSNQTCIFKNDNLGHRHYQRVQGGYS